MDILIAIIGGGVGAAVVTVVGQLLTARQARKYAKEDKETEELSALSDGVKWILYDRIKWLGLKYIEAGSVDFDDLRVLREMHNVYHLRLGGNGDLNKIMREVDSLPLRERGNA